MGWKEDGGTVLVYDESRVDPATLPPGVRGVPVLGSPRETVAVVRDDREVGRVLRRVLDAHLRDSDSLGVALLYSLAAELDPEHRLVEERYAGLGRAS